MSKIVLAIVVITAACGCCRRGTTQPTTHSSTSHAAAPPVIQLIEQLASPVPPKYATGKWSELTSEDSFNGYIHPQVEKAREQLVAMGTEIYPALVKHLDDDRYSYSGVYAAWVNHSVGQMIVDIMATGIEPHMGSYKSRQNPNGYNGPPSFEQMAKELGGFDKYASQAKGRSKVELQREYVEWHVAKERSYGFIDNEQERKVIEEYLKLLKRN
jgi:hypothetical protein